VIGVNHRFRNLLTERQPRIALGFGLLLALLVDALVGFWAYHSRQSAIDEWKVVSISLSRTIAQEVRQSMVASDLILASIALRVNEVGLQSPEEVKEAFHNKETFEMLVNRASVAPQVDVATIVDVEGNVVNFTRQFPPPPINLADRKYIKELRSDPNLDVVLSEPVRNRGNGTWTFYLARRIKGPQGDTLGFLLTGLHCAYFDQFFNDVSFSEDLAISLFRRDGILIARHPQRDSLKGTSFAAQPAFREIIAAGSSGVARLTFASQMRLVAPTAVAGFPLVVNVTVNDSLILGRWTASIIWIGSIAAALTLLILGMAVVVADLLLSQMESVREIGQQRQRADSASEQLLRVSRLTAMQEMSSAIAHELNQPLAATANYLAVADLYMGDVHEADGGRSRDVIARAQAQVQRAGDIIRRLRSFIDRGKGDEVEADLDSVIEAAISFSLIRDQHKDILVATNIANNLLTVRIDVLQVQQVILNLIRNAVEAMESSPTKRLEISAERIDEAFAQVRVRDSGPGLSEEARNRLFQPFNTTKKTGMGVGLSICRTIIEAHGGTIRADVFPGGGTAFVFTVPLARAQPVRKEQLVADMEAVP
jgi:signal transduction histidine kinase